MYIVLVQALGQREARDLLHPETHPGRSEHEAAGNHHLLGEMPARPGQEMKLRIGKVRGMRRPRNAGVQHPVHPLRLNSYTTSAASAFTASGILSHTAASITGRPSHV